MEVSETRHSNTPLQHAKDSPLKVPQWRVGDMEIGNDSFVVVATVADSPSGVLETGDYSFTPSA